VYCLRPNNRKDSPEDQLALIGNFDEMCLSFVCSSTNREGPPESFIYNPRFLVVGKATCKKSFTSKLITSSRQYRHRQGIPSSHTVSIQGKDSRNNAVRC
jgi:hypothetical protein